MLEIDRNMSRSADNYVPRIGAVGGVMLVLGALLLVFAAAVSNDAYARVLVSNTKDLAWGPTLFRSLLALHGVLLVLYALKRRNASTRNSTEDDDLPEQRATTRWTYLLLAGFSVIALILRVWNLNSDLWIDEVFTLLDFVRQPTGVILTSFPSQNQHMLFSLLAHLSTGVFGESAWAIRLPSVLFGVGSIWAFFYLARYLFGNREALLGCALMTVSYHHVWYSQNARGYMGLLLFTLLATWCGLEAIDRNTKGWWFGYVVSVVMGMWIHPTMAFVVAGHLLVYLIFRFVPRLAGDRVGRPSPEKRVGLSPFVAWAL